MILHTQHHHLFTMSPCRNVGHRGRWLLLERDTTPRQELTVAQSETVPSKRMVNGNDALDWDGRNGGTSRAMLTGLGIDGVNQS
jgi:hypothetical protein